MANIWENAAKTREFVKIGQTKNRFLSKLCY